MGESAIRGRQHLRQDEGILHRLRGDAELHHLRVRQPVVRVGCSRRLGRRSVVERGAGGVDQPQTLSLQRAKVDDQIGALGRRKCETIGWQVHGLPKQATIGAKLLDEVMHRRSALIEQHEAVDARVGAIEDAEAVLSRFDRQIRPDGAVDEREGTEKLHRAIFDLVQQAAGERAIGCGLQVAVLDQQGDLVGAGGQVQRGFLGIADEVQPGQTGIDVEAGDAHGMVVIPQQGRLLVVGVVARGDLAGQRGVLGPAIAYGSRATAMQMHHRPGLKTCHGRIGRPAAAAGLILRLVWGRDGGDGIGLVRGERVDPFNLHMLSSPDLNDGPWQGALVGPHLAGRQFRVQLELRGTHLHAQGIPLIVHLLWMQGGGNPQTILELGQRRCWLCHAAMPPE